MNKRIVSKVAGISFEGRQDVAKNVIRGSELKLVKDPENEYDKNAVKVMYGEDQLGFLNADLASSINADEYICKVTDITGGLNGKNIGINIELADPNTPKDSDIIEDLFGQKLYFNSETHEYRDLSMKKLISATQLQDSYTKEFQKDFIAKAVAKKNETTKEDVLDTWDRVGKIAREFGTVVHEALSLKIDKGEDTSLKTVNDIVQLLLDKKWFDVDKSKTEKVVKFNSQVGTIDLLEFIDDKTVNLLDFKIIKDIDKKVPKMLAPFDDIKTKKDAYAVQQSFYKTILEGNGVKVNSMTLLVFDGIDWTRHAVKDYSEQVIDIFKEI